MTTMLTARAVGGAGIDGLRIDEEAVPEPQAGELPPYPTWDAREPRPIS